MASSSGDDDFVILVCTNPSPIEAETEQKEILISTGDILSLDLPTILSYQTLKVHASRIRLVEQSSYFRGLLSGSFSESCLDFISIQWSLETFVDVLKCIYGCPLDVTSNNFVPLFEGALYFGVERLLLKCKVWFSEVSSSKDSGSSQIQLDDLIHIWRFGLECANDFLPELCASYLARNFMWAMSSKFFIDVPYKLLLSCTEHPHLTVDSEMCLSEALLVWVDANAEQLENFSRTGDDCHNVFRQIRISLLPLWYAAGKRRSCHFSKLFEESIDSIFRLMIVPPPYSVNFLGDGDMQHLRIRLTEYSKKVNLSGCPQITLAIMLLSVLPSSHAMEPALRNIVKHISLILESLEEGDRCHTLLCLLPMFSFEAVEEVDISKCSKLHLEAAIMCFSMSFPSIRTLKAAYLLNVKTTTILHQLVQKCPLLCEVDLTVDISPLIPAQVSVVSSSPAITPSPSNRSFSVVDNPVDVISSKRSGLSLSNITKLTLEGRSDLCDLDLQYISKFCASLQDLNLKACISVTDVGISNLLCKCMKLHSIVVCDTSFGIKSVLALCSSISDHDNDPAASFELTHNSLAFNLQKLHMGGCKGVDETSLVKLLSQTQMLKSLCLRDAHLVDQALHCFSGSSLEMLDVSNTMVSGAALAWIVRGNPGLKCLKVRGCRHMFQPESSTSGGEFSSSYTFKELYVELGKKCRLEEIALGWGFSYFSLEALQPAIMSLRSITVGLGGSLGENGLKQLSATCPMLESVILHFQVISDTIITNMMASLRNLRVLALCYCLGDISILSFNLSMPNLRKLQLGRVSPWMTNNDLAILTQNCANLVELSLLGCKLLNSDSQQIISQGCPGLTFIHLEDCGEVTTNGVSSLLDCTALEDLLLRHNGPGIQKNFIFFASSKLPMLRKVSLDLCDASEGEFDIPDYEDMFFLSTVKIAKCRSQRSSFNLLAQRRSVHKGTLVLVRNSKNLIRTVVKERL
ncbi:BTB/POZ domain-containing protein FBL11 isoform X4 [Alnus glutinosa]|uniref:BTB/POZ domain-containing protein FBL11 isoform X4 n=1 Tax=Alnus glutinosa TaxID=3517 RepID=UPI002D764A78|nr:BTB/POZ domain-containing protein FBL11 isoform X4 [Alnus glutinosa]